MNLSIIIWLSSWSFSSFISLFFFFIFCFLYILYLWYCENVMNMKQNVECHWKWWDEIMIIHNDLVNVNPPFFFSRKVCGNILINYSTIQWWSEYWTSPLFDWWKVAQLLNIWFSDGFWNKTKTITAKMFKFQSRIQKWHLNTVTFQMLSPIENRTK